MPYSWEGALMPSPSALQTTPFSLAAPTANQVARLVAELQIPREPSRQELIDALQEDQCRRWRANERIGVEAYRSAFPVLESDADGLMDLIFNEARLRQELGESIAIEEYLARFPQQAEALVRQFEVMEAIRDTAGSATTTGGGAPGTMNMTEPCAPSPVLTIPGFEILGVLGRGGMGVVYQARDQQLNRAVAIKAILAHGTADDAVRQRFRREAESQARLRHPNIVPIHAINEVDGQLYFVMEYIEGSSLSQKVKNGPWAPRQAAELVATLAGALQHAHNRGVIHRDLKPANILLDEDSQPHITDFGLARLLDTAGMTQSGAVMGTPAYMAPEQAKGQKDVGPCTDVFGLGAILYQLLTGRPPYQGPNARTTMQHAAQVNYLPPEEVNRHVPHELSRICRKALAADPKERYASAAALEADLRRYLSQWKRYAAAALAAAAVLVAALAGAGFAGFFHHGPTAATGNESPSPHVVVAPEINPEDLNGELVLKVYKKGMGNPLSINDPGVLPVHRGDALRIKAELNQPAHVYIVWLAGGDRKGDTVFPDQGWDKLGDPIPEWKPRRSVEVPRKGSNGITVDGETGFDTILLLARTEPLPPGYNLEAKIGPIPAGTWENANEYTLRSFTRGGESVEVEQNRGKGKITSITNETLSGLMRRLQDDFPLIRVARYTYLNDGPKEKK
jgi:serine/threonine-protein kinase